MYLMPNLSHTSGMSVERARNRSQQQQPALFLVLCPAFNFGHHNSYPTQLEVA